MFFNSSSLLGATAIPGMSGLSQRRGNSSSDEAPEEAQHVELVPSSSGRNSVRARTDNSNARIPEVICIDSEDSPRPRASRSSANGRKMRRLNNSTPVIVVDDDDEAAASRPRSSAINQSISMSQETMQARQNSTRASSSNSERPISTRVVRNRLQVAASSRMHRARSTPSVTTLTDESPATTEPTPNSAPIGNMPDPPPLGRLAAPSMMFRDGQRSARAIRYSGPDERGPPHGIRYRQVVFRVAAPAMQNVPRLVGRGGPRRARSPGLASLGTSILQQVAQSVLESGARHFEVRYLGGDALPDYETLVSLDEQLLRERNAAPKNVIDKLPEAVATDADKEVCCVICMSQIEQGEDLRVLPCSHKFHKPCIDSKCIFIFPSYAFLTLCIIICLIFSEWLTYNACCPLDQKRICDFQSVRRRFSPVRLRRAGATGPRPAQRS